MKKKKFNKIMAKLRTCSEEQYRNNDDKYGQIRDVFTIFNDHGKTILIQGNEFCADESMVPWGGSIFDPMHVTIMNNKPTPVGFMWKTLAESKTRVIITIIPQRPRGVAEAEMNLDQSFGFHIRLVTTYITVKLLDAAGLLRRHIAPLLTADSWLASVYTALVLKTLNVDFIGPVKRSHGHFPSAPIMATELVDNDIVTLVAEADPIARFNDAPPGPPITIFASGWSDAGKHARERAAREVVAVPADVPLLVVAQEPMVDDVPDAAAPLPALDPPPPADNAAVVDDADGQEHYVAPADVVRRRGDAPVRRVFVHTVNTIGVNQIPLDPAAPDVNMRDIPDVLARYYRSTNAVDVANHNRANMDIEKLRTKDWRMRVFLGILAISVANAFALYTFEYDQHAVGNHNYGPKLTGVQFMCELVTRLLQDPFRTNGNFDTIYGFGGPPGPQDSCVFGPIVGSRSGDNPRRVCSECQRDARMVCTTCKDKHGNANVPVCFPTSAKMDCLNAHLKKRHDEQKNRE